MVQTAEPAHPVMDALRSGDPTGFLEGEAARREAAGYPPFGDLIILEVRGDERVTDEEQRALAGEGAVVFGPLGLGAQVDIVPLNAFGVFAAGAQREQSHALAHAMWSRHRCIVLGPLLLAGLLAHRDAALPSVRQLDLPTDVRADRKQWNYVP